MKKLILLTTLFVLAACGDPQKLNQDFDRTNQVLHITVIFHDSLADLNRAYEKEYGDRNNTREGFAVWKNPGNTPYECEIHTLEPKIVDGKVMKTMGHELTHCVFGRFHE